MAQFARPDSDNAVNGWTATESTDLFDELDELSADDGATVCSQFLAFSQDSFNVGLSNVTDPASSSGHIMRARIWDDTGLSDEWEIILMQGAVQKASMFCGDGTATWITVSYTLSGAEADAITDYSDLRFIVVAGTSFGATGDFVISHLEFEVPDAGGGGGGATIATPGTFDETLKIKGWM